MFKEPRAVQVFKKAILVMVVIQALYLLWKFGSGGRIGDSVMIQVLLSVPVLILLLIYEVVRSAGGALRRRRDVVVRDEAFLRRFGMRRRTGPKDGEGGK